MIPINENNTTGQRENSYNYNRNKNVTNNNYNVNVNNTNKSNTNNNNNDDNNRESNNNNNDNNNNNNDAESVLGTEDALFEISNEQPTENSMIMKKFGNLGEVNSKTIFENQTGEERIFDITGNCLGAKNPDTYFNSQSKIQDYGTSRIPLTTCHPCDNTISTTTRNTILL